MYKVMKKKSNGTVDLHTLAVRLAEGGIVEIAGRFVRAIDVVGVVCTICSLKGECDGVEVNPLCFLLGAQGNEYFTESAAVYHDTTTDRYYIED